MPCFKVITMPRLQTRVPSPSDDQPCADLARRQFTLPPAGE
jgi:hypothetical protein